MLTVSETVQFTGVDANTAGVRLSSAAPARWWRWRWRLSAPPATSMMMKIMNTACTAAACRCPPISRTLKYGVDALHCTPRPAAVPRLLIIHSPYAVRQGGPGGRHEKQHAAEESARQGRRPPFCTGSARPQSSAAQAQERAPPSRLTTSPPHGEKSLDQNSGLNARRRGAAAAVRYPRARFCRR